MEKGIKLGINIINDVSGLNFDKKSNYKIKKKFFKNSTISRYKKIICNGKRNNMWN